MADLRIIRNHSTIVLPTIRGNLTIQYREDGNRKSGFNYVFSLHTFITVLCTLNPHTTGTTIQWNQRDIPVFLSDFECANGIIHIIDHPFIDDSDVRVTNGACTPRLFQNIAYVSILMLIAARTALI